MKVPLNELIIDKYYFCYKHTENNKYIFKYRGYDEYHIYSSDFELTQYKNEDFVYKLYDGDELEYYFCDIIYHTSSKVFEEIDISKFYQYLPDWNIDKICYLRKNKICYLLNI